MAAIADTERLRGRLARRGYEIFRTREYYPGERLHHRHEHYEVNMIWSGTMHYQVEGRTYHLTNGDILLLSPGQEHRPDPEGEQGSCERVVIWLEGDFYSSFPRRALMPPTASAEPGAVPVCASITRPPCASASSWTGASGKTPARISAPP